MPNYSKVIQCRLCKNDHLRVVFDFGNVPLGNNLQSSKYKSTEIARYFRNLNPPIIGYIKKNYFHIDLKAILDDQLDYISSSINSI